MSSQLEKVLKKEVPVSRVVAWLEGNCEVSKLGDVDCDIEEFVPCFINFLRDQAAGILSSEKKPSPIQEPQRLFSKPDRNAVENNGAQRVRSFSIHSVQSSAEDKDKQERTWRHKSGRKTPACISPGYTYERSSMEPKICQTSQGQQKRIAPVSVDKFDRYKHVFCSVKSEEEINRLRQQFQRTLGENNESMTTVYSMCGMNRSQYQGQEMTADRYLASQSKGCVKTYTEDRYKEEQIWRHKSGKTPGYTSLGHTHKRSLTEPKIYQRSQVQQRRIAPTSVDEDKIKDVFCSVKNEEEMNKLRQQFQRTLGENNENVIAVYSLPHVTNTSQNQGQQITADPCLVSHHDELHIMADIYCCLINFNYILNLMTELCFIICLLVVQPLQDRKVDKTGYLDTVHNCVYFASLMLNKLRHILVHFDIVTLKLLADNSRLRKFLPDLCNFINELLQDSAKQKSLPENTVKYKENVAYLCEEDNRMNFPNDNAFHAFCKQRDGFYEILRIWEAKYQSDDWSFGAVLAPKIRTLFALNNDSGNYVHFARLFKSLLLARCSRFNEPDEVYESSAFLGISNIDSKKLKCLQERFVTPFNTGDVCFFPGHQEFFRDFIIYSSNPVFLQHLNDSLNSEILVLNDDTFSASDLEDTKLFVDELTKKRYLTSLSALRLLGKFAGFIAFLPYHTQSTVLSEHIIAAQASVRDKFKPSLDIMKCLINGAEKRRLILTLPWIVEYLSQMDRISSHLQYFRSVFEMMFKIYQETQLLNRQLTGKTSLLIKLLLGSFFDSTNFSEELFFALYLKYRRSFSKSEEQVNPSQLRDPPLDELDVVDERCLYLCCPFIGQLKLCLVKDPGSLYSDSRNSAKRNVPVLASFHWSSKPAPTDEVQLDLEETFLHNQPVSTRRSIEYVAERVASCCVKYICNEVICREKHKTASRVPFELADVNIKVDRSNYDTLKMTMANKFNELASIGCREVKKRCDTEVQSYCFSRCKQALPALISDLEKPDVVSACVHISAGLSWEKVCMWIDKNLSESELIRDFKAEMCRTLKRLCNGNKIKSDSSVHETDLHDDTTKSVPRTIKKLKVLIRALLNNDQDEFDGIFRTLDAVKATVETRVDVVPSAKTLLPSLTMDLLLMLIINHPDFVQLDNVTKFLAIWNNAMPITISRLLCPRNVMLLSQSRHPAETVWSSMSQLISILLAQKILTPVDVEDQIIALLQRSWPQGILNLMSKCYEEIVENFRKDHPNETSEFSFMISWLSESSTEPFLDDYD